MVDRQGVPQGRHDGGQSSLYPPPSSSHWFQLASSGYATIPAPGSLSETDYEVSSTESPGFKPHELDQVVLRRNIGSESVFPIGHPWAQADDSTQLFEDLAKWDASRRTESILKQYPIPGSQDKTKPATSNPPRSAATHPVPRKSKKQKHKHLRCPISGCKSLREFSGLWELKRHLKTQHRLAIGDKRIFKCALSDCVRGAEIWWRVDKFREHGRQDHPEFDVESLIRASTIFETIEDGTIDVKIDRLVHDTQWKADQIAAVLEERNVHLCSGIDEGSSGGGRTGGHITSGFLLEETLASSLPILYQGKIPELKIDDGQPITDRTIPKEFFVNSSLGESSAYQAYQADNCRLLIHSRSQYGSSKPFVLGLSADVSLQESTFDTSEPADGHEGAANDRTYGGASSVHGHTGYNSGPSKLPGSSNGKRKRGDCPPDPPPGNGQQDYPDLGEEGFGYCCVFHYNPGPCRYKTHRTARFPNVSQLKRYHARHLLFYCGTCLTWFTSKEELELHEVTRCQRYRCVTHGCVNVGFLVKTRCPRHGRTNSSDSIYQWIQGLAQKMLQGICPRPESSAIDSEASAVVVERPMRIESASPAFTEQGHPPAASSALTNPTLASDGLEGRIDYLRGLIKRIWLLVTDRDRRDSATLRGFYNAAMRSRVQPSITPTTTLGQDQQQVARIGYHEELVDQLWQHRESVTTQSLEDLTMMYVVTMGEQPPQTNSSTGSITSIREQIAPRPTSVDDRLLSQPLTELTSPMALPAYPNHGNFAHGEEILQDQWAPSVARDGNTSTAQSTMPHVDAPNQESSDMTAVSHENLAPGGNFQGLDHEVDVLQQVVYWNSANSRFLRNQMEANSNFPHGMQMQQDTSPMTFDSFNNEIDFSESD